MSVTDRSVMGRWSRSPDSLSRLTAHLQWWLSRTEEFCNIKPETHIFITLLISQCVCASQSVHACVRACETLVSVCLSLFVCMHVCAHASVCECVCLSPQVPYLVQCSQVVSGPDQEALVDPGVIQVVGDRRN